MSERCATCAHWREERVAKDDDGAELFLDNPRISTYNLLVRDPLTLEPVTPAWPIGQCVSPALVQMERPVVRNGLSVIDGSGYAAALVTGPDFGCVNYQRREQEDGRGGSA